MSMYHCKVCDHTKDSDFVDTTVINGVDNTAPRCGYLACYECVINEMLNEEEAEVYQAVMYSEPPRGHTAAYAYLEQLGLIKVDSFGQVRAV